MILPKCLSQGGYLDRRGQRAGLELGRGALVVSSNAEALSGVLGSPGLNIPPGQGKGCKSGPNSKGSQRWEQNLEPSSTFPSLEAQKQSRTSL